MTFFVHQSSIIDCNAEIGVGSKIWHFCHVSSGATIGENVTLGQNCFIAGKAVIGNNCKIQNNVSVYDGVVLKDFVFVGPSVVFTNVNNPRSAIDRKSEFMETLVMNGVSLGANSTIVCGAHIGRYAFVAAGSVVKGHIKDYAMMAGVPAVQKGWVDEFGDKLDLPVCDESQAELFSNGKIYRLRNGHITAVAADNTKL